MQLAHVRPATRPVRKAQLLVAEMLHRGTRRAGPGEGVEQQAQAVLHLRVRIEDHTAERIVDQPHRQRQLQLPTPGLVQYPAAQPDTHHMQFGLTH